MSKNHWYPVKKVACHWLGPRVARGSCIHRACYRCLNRHVILTTGIPNFANCTFLERNHKMCQMPSEDFCDKISTYLPGWHSLSCSKHRFQLANLSKHRSSYHYTDTGSNHNIQVFFSQSSLSTLCLRQITMMESMIMYSCSTIPDETSQLIKTCFPPFQPFQFTVDVFKAIVGRLR